MKTQYSRFYLILTIILLLFVLIGFTRTFYLRPFLEQPERWQLDRLPTVYVIHGIILTAWFLLLVIQSALVNTRKVAIHKKLGYAMSVLAVLVVITSIQAVLDSTPRSIRMGLLNPENMDEMKDQSFPLFLDLLSLVVFTIAISIALVFRKNPLLHRTAVLIGSMAFMVVALVRATFLVFPDSDILLSAILFFLLPILLMVHDWILFKRFPVYAFVGLISLVLMVVLTFVIYSCDWGYQFFLAYISGLD
ncbi:MAG: hypothetical protein ACXIUD_15215 [Mongoliitalea sp.]